MRRGRKRTFDWDEARRRVNAGETKAAVARSLGVSTKAVFLACFPESVEINKQRSRRRQSGHSCSVCGAECSFNSHNQQQPICRKCYCKRIVTSATDTELKCYSCGTFKPDGLFSTSPNHPKAHIRRGRAIACRECDARRKREYRARKRLETA